MKSGYVRLAGLDIHHVYGGAGTPPVLFVHGLGSAGYLEWRFNLSALARAHRVYAPDLPGFGRSQRPPDGYGIPLFARVVHEYIRRRRLRPVLVGASMGGRVAMEVALQHPASVEKLVLVNALGVVRPSVQPMYPLMLLPRVGDASMRVVREVLHRVPGALIRRVAGRQLVLGGDPARVLDDAFLAHVRELHAAEGYVAAYTATLRSLARPSSFLESPQLLERLAATERPVLLIWGARDRLLPVARARLSHRQLPGAQLAVIEDAGHTPQAEQPERFNRLLEDFIAS